MLLLLFIITIIIIIIILLLLLLLLLLIIIIIVIITIIIIIIKAIIIIILITIIIIIIKDLERVQRRFTKRLFGLGDLSYVERLAHLHLDTLVDRRNHADLVTAYKALHGLLGISKESIGLQLQTRVPTRSHGTDFVVHKAINNNVKKVVKYRVSSQ